jgi:hypothetical protein
VSLGMHLAVSMRYTQSTIMIRRRRFLWSALIRPLLCLSPSLLLLPFWRKFSILPANPAFLVVWAILTLGIAWQVGLTAEDRKALIHTTSRLLYWLPEKT